MQEEALKERLVDTRNDSRNDDSLQDGIKQRLENYIEKRLTLLRENLRYSKEELRGVMRMPMTMKLQECESSNVVAYGYNEKSKVLAVRFRHGGEYRYLNVSRKISMKLDEAESKGRFINILKAMHSHVKMF